MLTPRSRTPRIDLHAAPPEEAGELRLLNHALAGIERHLQHFSDAVSLFDHCLTQQDAAKDTRVAMEMVRLGIMEQLSSWKLLASRDAVMSIWHFRKEIDTANGLANKSPFVSKNLRRSILGEAHQKFRTYFPDFEPMRHAVAHAGELSRSSAAVEMHSFSGNYDDGGMRITNANIMMQNSLLGRLYTCTFEGKLVQCEISDQTTRKMQDVLDTFCLGFTPETKDVPPRP